MRYTIVYFAMSQIIIPTLSINSIDNISADYGYFDSSFVNVLNRTNISPRNKTLICKNIAECLGDLHTGKIYIWLGNVKMANVLIETVKKKRKNDFIVLDNDDLTFDNSNLKQSVIGKNFILIKLEKIDHNVISKIKFITTNIHRNVNIVLKTLKGLPANDIEFIGKMFVYEIM